MISSGHIAALQDRKAELRREAVTRLRTVPAAVRVEAGRRASASLERLIDRLLPTRASIAMYAATPTELSCDAAIDALSRRHDIAFPQVTGGTLVFRTCGPEALIPSGPHLREPPEAAPVCTPSLVVVPGRCFDSSGARLGRGAGLYDRALSALPENTLFIGYSFALQLAGPLPAEPHDVTMHWLVTEEGEPLRCRPNAAHHPSHLSAPALRRPDEDKVS